ncbi:peptide antibiotic transporter SbmA [Rhodobacteraceae bacterium 2CG4]|uniref:Peptide antibiotic transporter SbmA n=1 Tax=Halovulum marinum TaxID=2662447 RepID=A0A6L5Z6R5_9RHOB|nr:peptide antibiotic transporter SbmA [Halovulum marinum]MSU91652.1 peptide antibiotic transporter SbmA [Halovulum marinum]
MFSSFFPRPGQFFGSALAWAIFCVILWYVTASDWGQALSLGVFGGWGYPEVLPPDAGEEAQAVYDAARASAQGFWFWEYLIVCFAAFTAFWLVRAPHPWARWSVMGSALIVFVAWFLVQLDVMINAWFGEFYDLIQVSLGGQETVTGAQYYATLATFLKIALVYITVAVINNFFTSHYVFRWRTAMNNRYMGMWDRIRHIEGASQRVQEDTMRFARIMETLGTRFIDSIMTLIAFTPILWGLSSFVKELPLIGEVPQALVFTALIWSAMGTGLLALAGIRLPGLEFRNQRVEAAYRKELVLGEDHAERAEPPTVRELYANVRKNYFRLYLNYLYFDIARFTYLQAGVMVPYIALGPTVITAGFTLGVMQQIIRAFGRVEDSFQFLVHNWSTIVELMSIYKRLAAFEAQIRGEQLSGIELEPETQPAE